ncbi:hypothetical protein [Thiobacillus sp.]|uniref:hypothetical protein n=1 Tax=Thiobacillus sp. TaxID=924 RepID=UPI0025F4EEFA|nr:hypothetical protein [Thiobacillus sp.]MBT9538987.1 hypothetical protein [Thiobacillus sp.]
MSNKTHRHFSSLIKEPGFVFLSGVSQQRLDQSSIYNMKCDLLTMPGLFAGLSSPMISGGFAIAGKDPALGNKKRNRGAPFLLI